MKAIRKTMIGASVGALALVALGGVNAEASVSVTFDTAKTIGSIKQGDSISFDAVKSTKNGLVYNAKAKWDLYEKDLASGKAVDISNLKTAKESYITVKNAAGEVEVYRVTADTQKKYKATCDGKDITITVDNTAVKLADMGKYSWRTANSGWTAFSTSDSAIDLTPYTMQGTTIYIRYTGNPSSSTTITPASATNKEEIEVGGVKAEVKTIAANAFSGAEFKVKVPKKANAPAITVDYAKGLIKKNAKAVTKEKIDGTIAEALKVEKWSAMTDNYTIETSKKGVLLMQIPEDTAKKKPASKIALFNWPAVAAPKVNSSYKAPAYNNGTFENSKGNIVENELTYEAKDNAKAEKATFVITNATDNVYEIFKADSNKKAEGSVVATIKGKATVTFTSKKLPATTNGYVIRYAGDKKAAKLPSPCDTNTFNPAYVAKPAAE